MRVIIAPIKLHKILSRHLALQHEQTENIACLEMPILQSVLEGLRQHTDMGMHMTPQGLVIEPSIHDEMKKKLLDVGVSSDWIIKGGNLLSVKYPFDIAYNCICVNQHLFHHAMTDSKILKIYEECGCLAHPVKQGYVKCATLIVGKNAVITEDTNLYKHFKEAGLVTLLIPKGEVKLQGFDYGFIGGAGGYYGGNLYLNGSLAHHSSGDIIEAFVINQGTEIIELHQGLLEDIGSIFIFDF